MAEGFIRARGDAGRAGEFVKRKAVAGQRSHGMQRCQTGALRGQGRQHLEPETAGQVKHERSSQIGARL